MTPGGIEIRKNETDMSNICLQNCGEEECEPVTWARSGIRLELKDEK